MGFSAEFIRNVIRAKSELNLYRIVEKTYNEGERIYLLNDGCAVTREKLLAAIEQRWKENFDSIADFLSYPWEKYRAVFGGNSATMREYEVCGEKDIHYISNKGEMPCWTKLFIPAGDKHQNVFIE